MKVEMILLPIRGDERGSLIAIEQNKDVNFDIKRVYYIFGSRTGVRRGFHAHKAIEQFAIALNGSCTILLDDGKNKKNVRLDSPNKGIYIDPLIWHEMFDFSDNCVLMVLANQIYDESDYIRDYDDFLSLTNMET